MKLTEFPSLVKEWHPAKNGELTPEDVTHGIKKKVWWLCFKGHSYDASVGERTRTDKPSGCPFCSGKRASEENNLQDLFPEIAREWHPNNNNRLTPRDFTRASDKKVWWLCPEGHTYEATVKNRTNNNSGCPFCAGKLASNKNNLQNLFPEIAKDWHPDKNGNLKPKDFTYGSKKEAWWLCPKGHSYKTSVNTRTNQGSGCPNCTKQTSEPEIRILSELKMVFDLVEGRHKVDKVEVDVFLPEFNLGIEYDGWFWHKDKKDKDLQKGDFLLSKGVHLIRVRELPLDKLSSTDILVKPPVLSKSDLDKIFKGIYDFVDSKTQEKIDEYIAKTKFLGEGLFNKYKSYFPSPFPENSLLSTHPSIASMWDYDKNYPLTPENFTYGSRSRVWWLCSKGHSYDMIIVNRTTRCFGCTICSGHKLGEDNTLLARFPDIASEWHSEKNGKLTPADVTSGTHKTVWWLCQKGHSYDMPINSRTRKKSQGCPYCSGRRSLTKDLFE